MKDAPKAKIEELLSETPGFTPYWSQGDYSHEKGKVESGSQSGDTSLHIEHKTL